MSQGDLALPLTGVYGGLAAAGDINAAIEALLTESSGNSAPTNAPGGAPILGQIWLDTTNSQYKRRKYYDGANWVGLGAIDATNHLWLPPIGGGIKSGVASAATVDLGSYDEATVELTGTTAITSFGSSAAIGTIRHVICGGASKITDGTDIECIGGADITPVAGSRMVMQYRGSGVWRMLDYSSADGKPIAVDAVTSLDGLTHLGVNATADTTNRLSVLSNAALFDAVTATDGGNGDFQVKVNKETSSDFATILFQTGGSGRGELGLSGADDFHIKVSPDGSTWYDSLVVAGTDGATTFLKQAAGNFKTIDEGTVSSGTVTFSRSAANMQRLQVGGALTIAVSNWPTSGLFGDLILEIVNGGAAAITWPTLKWIKGDGSTQSTPYRNLQASGTDWIVLFTRDGGSNVYARFL
jgi:hypothetical protein